MLIFVLGMKHGLDADHISAIDGLTRHNQRQNPRLARYCGTFFSLGHGAVVIGIALVVSTVAGGWAVPPWLANFGAATTILFLLAVAWLNIRAALDADLGRACVPVGLKGRLLGFLARVGSPGLIALVGALFAVSFDTISQTALFARTASREGGWQYALLLGCLFTTGMLATDGTNGYWMARLMVRADQNAWIVSRVVSLAIGGISLLVAAFWSARLAVPGFDAWSTGCEWVLGAAVAGIGAICVLVALRLTRTASAPAKQSPL